MIRSQMRLRPWKRHSLVLMVLGVVYVLIGITYAFSPMPPDRMLSLKAALLIMPMAWWGTCFIAAGGLGILSSRWPPASETWGYVALSSLSALWASFYVWGVLVYGAPAYTLSAALLWAGVAFLWWAISGLVNPTERSRTEGA